MGSQPLSVSNEELIGSSIKIYPNPAEDSFTIKFQNLTVTHVEIYNILGKLVYKDFTNNGSIGISNNKNFPSGVYMVKAKSSNNKIHHAKLIIK